MKATNKKIAKLLTQIEDSAIRVPIFQRGKVWSSITTTNFLQAVLDKHPLGVLLLLDVNPQRPPFRTKPIVGAKRARIKGECRLHLLDGQQRLTALLQALKDNDDKCSYYIEFASTKNNKYLVSGVKPYRKSYKWHSQPDKEFEKGLLPMRILEPNNNGLINSNKWINTLTKDDANDKRKKTIQRFITDLRKLISTTDIPQLTIPLSTKASDALRIFVNFNTSSVKLTEFDIANAMCVDSIKTSLHKYVEDAKKAAPTLTKLEGGKGEFNLGDMILLISCIDQDIQPTKANYEKIDYKVLKNRIKFFIECLKWTEEFLVKEGFGDERWFPSVVPLRVIPLLYEIVKDLKRHKLNNANTIIRKYLWRSFLTDRYMRQANNRLYRDYKYLVKSLSGKTVELHSDNDKTIFNEDEEGNKLPSLERIMNEGWPKSKGTLKKAILAICVHKGAQGLETGTDIGSETTDKREYHHIYPKNLLKGEGTDAELAVNCMLIEPEANKSWHNSWPGDWLSSKTDAAKSETIVKDELVFRLESHTLPSNLLLKAKKKAKQDINCSYNNFTKERAKLIHSAMLTLFNGDTYR